METRHGIYAGIFISFIVAPELTRNIVVFTGAAAICAAAAWLWATGRSW
jgi:hypothetical protein